MTTVTSLKNYLSKTAKNISDVGTENSIFCADIGTSSLKAALICSDGKVLAFSQQNFIQQTPDKISEQWLNALVAASKSFGKKLKTVKGICISGNGPTIVSDDGTTLLWNDALPQTNSSHASSDSAEKFANKSAAHAALAQPEKPSSAATEASCKKTKSLFIPRLLAFRKKYPKQWNDASSIFSGPEYLLYVLSDNAVTILPEERFKTAYWSPEELLRCGITADEQKKLPSFVPPAFNCGNTTQKITELLGLDSPVPVFCGAPDFVAALIGTNTLKSGKICDRAGSSEGINFCTEHILDHPRIRMLPSVISGLWNASVLFPSSGKLFSEYKRKTEKETGRKIEYNALVEQSLNDIKSEGFAIMKNLAEKTKEALEILSSASAKAKNTSAKPDSAAPMAENKTTHASGADGFIRSITITGGQAKSEKWIQMKANVCRKTFELCAIADSELSGDAVLGFTGLGIYKSIQEAADAIVKTGKVFEPDDPDGLEQK